MSANQLDGVTSLEPVGVQGCPVCVTQSRSREIAREAAVVEVIAACNAEIRNHPHRAVGEGRKLPVVTLRGVAV
jgi:uncharacterized protein (UPF0212 family)